MIFEIVVGLFTALAAFSLFIKLTMGVCRSKKDMTGKVVIVTGANCGIGQETARELVRRNATVILACRNIKKGQEAVDDIAASTGKGQHVQVKQLDLSSLASVRRFSEEILKSQTRLDVLINNAGVMMLPSKEMTEDGLDLIFATNHFGPFLLTNLLLPLLKSSAPSRIVMVASDLHHLGSIDLDDIKGTKDNGSSYKMYNATKLANVLVSLELSQRLKGTGVTVNSLHPGVVATELDRNMHSIIRTIKPLVTRLFLKTPKEGAQTSIYLAVSEEVEDVTGKYFVDCKPRKPSSKARDKILAKQLWDSTATITGVKYKKRILL